MIIEVSTTVSPTKTESKRNPAMLLMLVIGVFLFVATLSFCYIAQSSSPNRSLLEASQDRNLASGNYDNYGDDAYGNDPYGNDNVDTYDNPYGYDPNYGNDKNYINLKNYGLDNTDPNADDNTYGTTSGKSSGRRNTHHHSKKKGNKVSNGNVVSPASSNPTGATTNVPTTTTSSTTTVQPSTGTTTATQPSNTGTSGSTTTSATTTIPGTSNPNVLAYSSNERCSNGNTAYLTGLTADQKAVVVAAHNTYRSLVALGNVQGQPGATDMLEMVWDDDLAAKAQTWANACVFDHDTDSSRRTAKFSNVGQNIDIYMSSAKVKKMDFTTFVKDWFDEVKLFSGAAPTNSYQDISGTGHYTQLVWAKSYAVGCGFKVYQGNGMYSYQLTCNYGPAGNWLGEKIYTKGTFNAANCKNGASSTYQGLCNH